MESLDLDESIKREAFLIAKGRQEVADKIKRPEGLFHDYDPLEANWQGAIAEVFLKRMFPSLLLSQPYVVESDKTTECDFILEKEGIEVKCNRFHSIYPVFFVNKTRFLKKFDHTRKVVCCAINDSPSKASKFYIFGWLEAAKVKEYPVETRYSSPAYAVPIEDFLPMDKLFDNPLWHARRDLLISNQHQGPTRPVHGDLEMSLPLNQVVVGDCTDVMQGWPADSIDLVVTSPPYWGLRDYGSETVRVWGGDHECEHEWNEYVFPKRGHPGDKSTLVGTQIAPLSKSVGGTTTNTCVKCGAWRGSLGLEPHPQLFIDHLVEICREIRRVLKPTGTFWLNLGDTFYGSHAGKIPQAKNPNVKIPEPPSSVTKGNWLQPKQKLMIPARVAIALQHEGWILRSDIIWHKPNAMPSSVKDRLTCVHEHIFLFAKQRRYYFDLDAIRVPHSASTIQRITQPNVMNQQGGEKQISLRGEKTSPKDRGSRSADMVKSLAENYEEWYFSEREKKSWHEHEHDETMGFGQQKRGFKVENIPHPRGKNPGDIWRIPTRPFPGAHFATFPPKLIEPIIKAGSPRWVCSKCGKPRTRILEEGLSFKDKEIQKAELSKTRYNSDEAHNPHSLAYRRQAYRKLGLEGPPPKKTVGWSDCGCGEKWVGGIVMDPFGGSGTVGQVARRLGRRFILIEIIPEYCKMAEQRVRGKYKPVPEGVAQLDHFMEAEGNG